MKRSLVSTYGCVSCNVALADSLGAADARRGKDRRRHCYESRNTVGICTIVLIILLTLFKSRSYVNYPFHIHSKFDSTGCIM
jgi:hypothetical protein